MAWLSEATRTRARSRALRAGVSLLALAWGGRALGQTMITTAIATPVATATAAAGAPDNIAITSSGSIKTTTAGPLVTINSSNTVSNAGSLITVDVSDTTGVLVVGGNSGAVTNTNVITLNESATATDTNGDGNLDGPFASGSGRYGLRVTGPGTFSGNLVNATGGVITAQGNDSAGISIETNLAGSVVNAGTISVTGDRVVGVRTTGTVSGDVSSLVGLTATGLSAQGLAVGGDVGGGVVVEGALTATGYRYTTRSTDAAVLSKLGADDLLQGGPAVSIGANVARGFLVGAPPVVDATNPDVNGNGVPDAGEVAGTITAFGAAPAVVIGAVGRSVTLGAVGTGSDAYGIVNHGTIIGSGVYDGVSATGLQLGVAGGGAVLTTGGLHNLGAITAQSYAADATGLVLKAGAAVPLIHNDGTIGGALASDQQGATARALLIEAGASSPVLQNAGGIAARVAGQKADSLAITDRSGTLTEIENVRTISALRSITDATAAVTGRTVAIDVSANTSGVHLVQTDISGGATLPAITGGIAFGSGADVMDIQAGTIAGDIAFGAGANALNISGNATVAGRLTATGGTLGLNLAAGALQINGVDPVSLTSLNIGAGSTLIVTADPAAGAATRLDVAGTATIANGAKLGVRLASLANESNTYTLIRADHLTAGEIDSSLLGATPFLFDASLQTDAMAGTVSLTLARKSAAELQLNRPLTAAYGAIVASADTDTGLRGLVLAQNNRANLVGLFNQLLPNYNGGVFRATEAAARAFARPLDDRQDPEGGGVWVQAINTGVFAQAGTDGQAYKSIGFGMVTGYERPASNLGVLGATFGFSAGGVDPKGAAVDQKLTADVVDAGVYWRATAGAFSANARLAGDYLHVGSHRVVNGVGADGAQISRTAKADWSGYGVNGRLMGSYEAHIGGRFSCGPRPASTTSAWRRAPTPSTVAATPWTWRSPTGPVPAPRPTRA